MDLVVLLGHSVIPSVLVRNDQLLQYLCFRAPLRGGTNRSRARERISLARP